MRISDLATELMTTGKELMGLLKERGIPAKSTFSSLTAEQETFLRDEIKRLYYTPKEEPAPAPGTHTTI